MAWLFFASLLQSLRCAVGRHIDIRARVDGQLVLRCMHCQRETTGVPFPTR